MIANAKPKARDEALLMHHEFSLLAFRLKAGGKFSALLSVAAAALAGKVEKCSEDTLRRKYKAWKQGGRKPEALLPRYKGGARRVPKELIRELKRLSTLPGVTEHSVAIDAIVQAWNAGKEVPGVGTWKDFWITDPRTKRLPLPDKAPDFFDLVASRSTLYRYAPETAAKRGGNLGFNEAKQHLLYTRLNYKDLRKGELYTLDDVRLDLVCIDEVTGKVTTVVCYIMMEVASRRIVGYLVKPAESIKAEDVDELVSYTLQTCGVGVDYVTHILFERGTVACSASAQAVLEGMTDGGIKVHRTGMVGGIQWVGAPSDRAKGNSSAKGVIEAFNRQLHLLLKTLPGQRGNSRDTQPASLGFTGQRNKDGSHKTHRNSLVERAETLDALRDGEGKRLKLDIGLLYFGQLMNAVRTAIKRHNSETGHDYRGHGKFEQFEVAPGVWKTAEELPELSRNSISES